MYSSTDEGLSRGDRRIVREKRSMMLRTKFAAATRRMLHAHPSSDVEYAATFSRREKVFLAQNKKPSCLNAEILRPA